MTSINNAPTIEANDIEIVYGSSFDARDYVKVADKEEGDITDRVIVKGDIVDTLKPGTYKVIYEVSDSQGATATKEITVKVKFPLTIMNSVPKIEAKDIEILYGSEFNPYDYVKAYDNEDGDITDRVLVSGDVVNTSKVGTYKVIYTVSDLEGATITKEISVKVILPLISMNEAPTIEADTIRIMLNDKDFDLLDYVKAYDKEDGDITHKVIAKEHNVNTSIPGTYRVIYEVVDSGGIKTTKEVEVKVIMPSIVMNAAPIINAKNIEILVGSKFNAKDYVSATDEEDGDLTDSVIVKTDEVNVNKAGTYKVVYEVVDSVGIRTTKEIEVKVIQPMVSMNSAPTLNVSDIEIFVGDKLDLRNGISAIDVEDGDLTENIVIDIPDDIDTSKRGTYPITYSVLDSGGIKTSKTITLTIYGDEDIPTITTKDGGDIITISIGDKFNVLDYIKATDIEEGDISSSIEVLSSNVDTSKVGVYSAVCKIANKKGLSRVVTIQVVVKNVVSNNGANSNNGNTNSNNSTNSNSGNTSNSQGSTSKPQTGDEGYLYGLISVLSLFGLKILNKKKDEE